MDHASWPDSREQIDDSYQSGASQAMLITTSAESRLKDARVYCPKLGRHGQRDDKQIFLVLRD